MRKLIVLVLAASAILAACSSGIQIESDFLEGTDFSPYKTYTWYEDLYPPEKSEYGGMSTIDERMREATDKALRARGFRENSVKRGDFLVHYQVSAQTKQNAAAFNDYYNREGMHGSVSTGTYGSSVAIGYSTGSKKPKTYREGTIVIDILDRERKELIWRGYGEGKLPQSMSLGKRNQIIREVVPAILSKFPPGSK